MHTCHMTNCTVNVPPEMFSCRKHWFSLPKGMRDKIWATYRAGQCDDMSPSADYCLAARAAVTYVAGREGVTPDTRLYDLILTRLGHSE